jgi:hypothetical protein
MPLGVKLTLDRASDTLVAKYSQPDDEIRTILRWNREYAADLGDTRLNGKARDLRLVARIPEVAFQAILVEHGITMRELLLDLKHGSGSLMHRLLNDHAMLAWRTWHGRI